MKRRISLIGMNILALALMIGHLLYVAIVYPSDTAIMVNIGIAAFYAVALFLVDVGFLLAWLIRKKKQSKFKILFLILNGIVLLSMIITVAYVVLSYDAMETSASPDVYFLLSLLFLPPLFMADLFLAVVYWLWKRKRPKFQRIFLILNMIVLIVMILYVCGVAIRSNYPGASQDTCYLLSFLFLPPLFITDAVTAIVYWIRKKWKKPQTSCN